MPALPPVVQILLGHTALSTLPPGDDQRRPRLRRSSTFGPIRMEGPGRGPGIRAPIPFLRLWGTRIPAPHPIGGPRADPVGPPPGHPTRPGSRDQRDLVKTGRVTRVVSEQGHVGELPNPGCSATRDPVVASHVAREGLAAPNRFHLLGSRVDQCVTAVFSSCLHGGNGRFRKSGCPDLIGDSTTRLVPDRLLHGRSGRVYPRSRKGQPSAARGNSSVRGWRLFVQPRSVGYLI